MCCVVVRSMEKIDFVFGSFFFGIEIDVKDAGDRREGCKFGGYCCDRLFLLLWIIGLRMRL